MSNSQPKVGDRVLYQTTHEQKVKNAGRDVLPAVILHVHEDGSTDLSVSGYNGVFTVLNYKGYFGTPEAQLKDHASESEVVKKNEVAENHGQNGGIPSSPESENPANQVGEDSPDQEKKPETEEERL